ncbi:hypothetical protein DSAG12_01159 [Promethearchaeum syntrophicum]|uniref:Uncharacterized protein n=1 Tax=Promethearchaeum syntrophicum TaxID=2594042 RepID=A0A5B9D876_9ARCH|nr:hypothetical protein [Candidatus Prometheoarchaeum syntrophicum]QEE15334.1 chromosome segregation protein [Candidatus Prometheoarchaeum syntrophicum]
MSFWNEVDGLIEKGKTSKQIKVTADDLIELRNKMKDLQLSLSTIEKNLQVETEKVKIYQRNFADEQEKVNMLQRNISEKVSIITQREGEITQIQQHLNEKNTITTQLQAELDNLKADIGKRDLEIKNAFTTVTQAEEMLGKRDQQIEDFKSLINQKNLEIDEMKRNLNEGQQNAASLNGKEQELERLRKEIQSSQSQDSKVPGLQLKIQTLQAKIQELESNSVTRADFDSIFNQNKELEGRFNSLNFKVGALTNENEQLKGELAEKMKKINSLTEPHAVMTPSLGKSNNPSTITSTTTDDAFGTARIVCPHCGSSKLTVIEDKSRIISYIPAPVYAKKNVCSQCGFEF